MSLTITPMHLSQANAFVATHHRHHKPVKGMKFAVGVSDEDVLRGVVIVGRPVARRSDTGETLEVNRCCTDGAPNACSFLYGAARRVAKELGYKRMITYTLLEEGGASLRASGARLVGERGGGNWNVASRPRTDTAEALQVEKHLWEWILRE